jgi:hypothetical protein
MRLNKKRYLNSIKRLKDLELIAYRKGDILEAKIVEAHINTLNKIIDK